MKKVPDHHKGLAEQVLSENANGHLIPQSKYGLKRNKAAFKLFLTPRQLAAQLGVSEKTLERWRRTGKGPAFHKIMNKRIRYYVADVDAWLDQNRMHFDTS